LPRLDRPITLEPVIVDCHTHLGEADGRVFTPDDLLRSMDVAAIDQSIIIAERTGGWYSSIEHLSDLAARQSRFKVLADVNFAALDVAEINRLVGLLESERVVGLKFYTGYEEYYGNNEKLFPLYEYCQQHEKPVMFHTGSLERANRGLLKYCHPLTIDEVAHAFPSLRIVIAHMGNPWLLDCAAVMAKNQYVYADVSAFFDEFRPITPVEIDIFVKRLSDVRLFLGSFEKFLFGTDWPLYEQDQYLAAMEALGMAERERELVLGENARTLFRL
jgi:predicted TIM-barrel fold metal-dependent hydrolase